MSQNDLAFSKLYVYTILIYKHMQKTLLFTIKKKVKKDQILFQITLANEIK